MMQNTQWARFLAPNKNHVIGPLLYAIIQLLCLCDRYAMAVDVVIVLIEEPKPLDTYARQSEESVKDTVNPFSTQGTNSLDLGLKSHTISMLAWSLDIYMGHWLIGRMIDWFDDWLMERT